MVPDPSKVPLGAVITLSTGEGDDAAVAVSFRGEGAWNWTGESYLHRGRHPGWRLAATTFHVDVTVRADGREMSDTFVLDAGQPPEAFALVPETW